MLRFDEKDSTSSKYLQNGLVFLVNINAPLTGFKNRFTKRIFGEGLDSKVADYHYMVASEKNRKTWAQQ